MPARVVATVRSLERNSLPNAFARAGDNVTVNLQGVEANRVVAGGVLCHPDFPIKVSNQLELKIVILNITTPLLIGSQVLCPPAIFVVYFPSFKVYTMLTLSKHAVGISHSSRKGSCQNHKDNSTTGS